MNIIPVSKKKKKTEPGPISSAGHPLLDQTAKPPATRSSLAGLREAASRGRLHCQSVWWSLVCFPGALRPTDFRDVACGGRAADLARREHSRLSVRSSKLMDLAERLPEDVARRRQRRYTKGGGLNLQVYRLIPLLRNKWSFPIVFSFIFPSYNTV